MSFQRLQILDHPVPLQFHDFELVVIHFSHDLRLPLLVEQCEFLAEVDRLVTHMAAPSVIARHRPIRCQTASGACSRAICGQAEPGELGVRHGRIDGYQSSS
jgi:hypothetical protein